MLVGGVFLHLIISSRKCPHKTSQQMLSDALTFFDHTDLLSTVPLPTLVLVQKGGQVHRNKIGERILNTLSAILESSSIGFSTRKNAQYGVSEFVAILMKMSESNIASEEAIRLLKHAEKKMPSPKWFRNRINSLGSGSADKLCRDMLTRTARLAKNTCRYKGGVLVAIDKHLIPRHDKDNMSHLTRSKPKGGTSKFECYATMHVVAERVPAILECMQVTRSVDDADFVRKFVQKLKGYRIRARLLLMDREFYSTEIINLVSEHRCKFLMPAVKNAGIKRMIREHHDKSRKAVSQYAIRNAAGQSATFTLIITPSKKIDDPDADITERYNVFATNLSPAKALEEIETLPDEYKSRWGIETGYKQVEQVRPRTTSRNASFRGIMFHVSMFMYNAWAVEQYRTDSNYDRVTLALVAYATAMAALELCRMAGQPYDVGGSA